MAIYDAGTASLAADGTVIGVGTTWRQPLTLIRVGATMIFNTTPASIVTIAEIISDTEIRVFNDKGFTAPAGTQYSILAHDGITVQGLAQDVAETLRYYQSRETEVAAAVDAFNQFDADAFQTSVNQVNTQSQQVSIDSAQVASDKADVSAYKDSAAASAASALSDKNSAAQSAIDAANSAASVDAGNLLKVSNNLGDLSNKTESRENLSVYEKSLVIRQLNNIEELRSFEPEYTGGQVVEVKGYYNTTPGRGGGKFIAYDGSDTDDGVFTFVTPGGIRWKRVINKKGPIDVEIAGVMSERTAQQNTDAFDRLLSSIPQEGGVIKLNDFYNVRYGLIIKPRVELIGIGSESCGIRKVTNDIREVPDRTWGASPVASYSLDFVVAIDIDNDPNGDLTGNQTRRTTLKGFSIIGAGPARNTYGIYSYISYLSRYEDLLIRNVQIGYRTSDSWLQYFSNVMIDGVEDGFSVDGGGTTWNLSNVYVKNSSRWAFNLRNITYSTLTCCAVDYCYGSAYVLIGCTGVALNGCGAEEIHGSLFECNNSRLSISAFRSVNVFDTGSVAAIFTQCAVSFDSSLLTEFVLPTGTKYWQVNNSTINLSNVVAPDAGRFLWGTGRSILNYTDFRGTYSVIGDSTSVIDGYVTAGVYNFYRSVPPDSSVNQFPVGTTWTITSPLPGNVYKYVYTSSGWKYASTLSQ